MKKYNEKISKLSGAALAFLGTFCLPYILNLKGNVLAVSNSWFGVFIWAVIWFLTDRAADGNEKRDRREKTAAVLLGGAFSFCLAFGVSLEQAENVDRRRDDVGFGGGLGCNFFPLDM